MVETSNTEQTAHALLDIMTDDKEHCAYDIPGLAFLIKRDYNAVEQALDYLKGNGLVTKDKHGFWEAV